MAVKQVQPQAVEEGMKKASMMQKGNRTTE
jgi:hypothetical protein